MPIRDPQAVLQKLGQTTLKVDTYFLQRTGFVANQTILKLGEYNLHCVPATIAVEESRFLAVLTPVEVNHFARFKVGTHILILSFDDPDRKDVARFHLRVSLIDIVPVPERKSVCFLLLKLKSLPAEFVLFLGDYLEALDERKVAWETQATDPIEASPGAGSLDPKALVAADSDQVAVTIRSFHTKRIELTWSESPEPWASRPVLHLRTSVRGHALVLEGKLDPEGAFLPEFHPDWLAFVEDLRFQDSLKNRPGTRAHP